MNRDVVDVVIVGGGLAGAALALGLRKRGVDAVAFERGRYPRPRVCGAVLSPGALDQLRSLGLLEAVLSGPVREIRRVRLRWGESEVTFGAPTPAFACARERLDAILARAAGVREGHTVGRISETGAGFLVEVRDPGGATLEVAGRVVVDAGGRTSRLSPASGSGGSFGVRYSEPRDPGDTLEFGFFDWGYGGTVGTGDGEANSAFLVSRSALSRFLGRGDCQVTGPIAYRRRPSPWIRVGDAAGMVDPFSGEGMRQAFDSAARVAGLLARGLHAGWRYPTMREAARAQAGAGAFSGPDRLLRALSHRSWPGRALRVPGLGALVLEALWRRP